MFRKELFIQFIVRVFRMCVSFSWDPKESQCVVSVKSSSMIHRVSCEDSLMCNERVGKKSLRN